MTLGLSAANLANKWLDMLGASAFTAPAAFYVKLHTGDPGSAGANNASSVTTRVVATWAAASGGSKSANGTLPSWASWAGTSPEVVTHLSFWDASTAGNFLGSVALSSAQTVTTGSSISLTALTWAFTPIAA